LNLDILKEDFAHKFAIQQNLFYIGNKPEKYYYEDLENYDIIRNTGWDFKQESLKYLENDLHCLLSVLLKVNASFFQEFDINIANSNTIAGLALGKFLKHYYKDDSLGLIKEKRLFNDIKKAYYGGITEVYKPYGKDLYYYDVNSLYPYVALQDMPGRFCSEI